jgi:threonine/homoserine/homoserine lactone efflux protein
MSPDPAVASDAASAHTQPFDRAAIAILGTMLTLIVMLTALLVTVSQPDSAESAPTAQTALPSHRA